MFLQGAVWLFLVMEVAKIAALYFTPGSRRFNAVGVFAGWEESKTDPNQHDLMRYLVWWVAGTKVIFVALWLVILLTAPATTQVIATLVMIPAVATFYWRLFPLARRLDERGKMRPRGYAKVLGWMIAGMLLLFVVAAAVAWPNL